MHIEKDTIVHTHLELLGVSIDGNNALGFSLNAALNDGQTNATHTNDGNSRAFFDLSGLNSSAVASGNTATK